MLSIKADIYLKKTEEGGLTKSGFSDMQPSFAVAGDLIICRVRRSDGEKEMPLGKHYEVDIDLPYGEKFADHIKSGSAVRLQIGSRVIADGVVK